MNLATYPEGAIRQGPFRLGAGEASIRWFRSQARVMAGHTVNTHKVHFTAMPVDR
jgi:hypothetical protein